MDWTEGKSAGNELFPAVFPMVVPRILEVPRVFPHGLPFNMDPSARSHQAALRDVGGGTLSGDQCNSSMHIPKASGLHS